MPSSESKKYFLLKGKLNVVSCNPVFKKTDCQFGIPF